MAQNKFKLNSKTNEEELTHAHTQTKEKMLSPIDVKGSLILSGVNLSVSMIKFFEILSPRQKQQLLNYAELDDRTAGCVIKELLIQKGIIEE